MPCPYALLEQYSQTHGPFATDNEPFFIFKNRIPIKAQQINSCLKLIIKKAGFNPKYYGMHSFHAGRSCDLYKLGVSVETIMKLGC